MADIWLYICILEIDKNIMKIGLLKNGAISIKGYCIAATLKNVVEIELFQSKIAPMSRILILIEMIPQDFRSILRH